MAPTEPLAERLEHALGAGDDALDALADAEPNDEFDALDTLLTIHDLWCAPLGTDGRERHQGHPAVAALKRRLEAPILADLEAATADHPLLDGGPDGVDAVGAMRRIARAADDRIYDWIATEADAEQLLRFLTLEGGPDAGFDDLVATCQVGLRGPAKVVLGANYWDEMGCGDPALVHTVLHDRMATALRMPRLPRSSLPVAALAREALGGVLATNRWLQPELVGALGLLELQAGPRCRRVVTALRRLGAPADALPFYEEHAETDPRHGKEWLDGAVAPLVAERPDWAARIVRGALWRDETNRRFFADVARLVGAAGALEPARATA